MKNKKQKDRQNKTVSVKSLFFPEKKWTTRGKSLVDSHTRAAHTHTRGWGELGNPRARAPAKSNQVSELASVLNTSRKTTEYLKNLEHFIVHSDL